MFLIKFLRNGFMRERVGWDRLRLVRQDGGQAEKITPFFDVINRLVFEDVTYFVILPALLSMTYFSIAIQGRTLKILQY